jgi:ribosomal subunit interface protein
MRIKIIGDNIDINPRIRKLVIEKVGEGLEKYLPKFNQEIKTATVRIKKHSRWGYKINFDMWLPEKYHIYAEERKGRLLSTLVGLRDQLIRQIKEYKGRLKENE